MSSVRACIQHESAEYRVSSRGHPSCEILRDGYFCQEPANAGLCWHVSKDCDQAVPCPTILSWLSPNHQPNQRGPENHVVLLCCEAGIELNRTNPKRLA